MEPTSLLDPNEGNEDELEVNKESEVEWEVMEPNSDYNLLDFNEESEELEVIRSDSDDNLLEYNEESEVIPLYGICIKCKKPRSHFRWCQSCERKKCEENFANWTSGNEEIDQFIKKSQLDSTSSRTFLEWIPFDRLKHIKSFNNTVYSAVWEDGPRIIWDQQNEQFKRSKTQVHIQMLDDDNNQVKTILNELKTYLDCNVQDNVLSIQFYGISMRPGNNEYFIVKKRANHGLLKDYVAKNYNFLDWETKLHLLYYIAEDLKVLHNAGYIHRNFDPRSIIVFDNNSCAIGSFSRCQKPSPLPDKEEVYGWQAYLAPEYLRNQPYTKASDVYAFGMIMYTVGTGNIPYYQFEDDFFLTIDICHGTRPDIPNDIPNCFKELMERCWDSDPRPKIDEVSDILLKWWSLIYHGRYLYPVSGFLVANDKNLSKSTIQQPQETFKNSEDSNEINSTNFVNEEKFDPLNYINHIINNKLVKMIDSDELTDASYLDKGNFGTVSIATWEKINSLVVCKRLKNDESISYKPIEAFLHELNMHKRLDFCSRIIRILGISFDKSTKEYLLVMEYADGGNLRNYLKRCFSTLTWNDKFKLAYQITEGIKYLHGENIFHRDLHSKNVVIHKGEAKIIDLGIAKSTETETNIHQGLFGMIPYIDPKLLENNSYIYDNKSDIYSLGVLMWELSSGHPPFNNNENVNLLSIGLIKGIREDPIPNTPAEYLKLYQTCWDVDSAKRPSIYEVFTELKNMLIIELNTLNTQGSKDEIIVNDKSSEKTYAGSMMIDFTAM